MDRIFYTLSAMLHYLQSNWIFGLGFFAQFLFGLRMIVQWWVSEKKKQVTSPSLFWKLSLAAAVLFLIYGILRTDIVIVVGQLLSYFIYLRNLYLKQDWNKFGAFLKLLLVAFPIGAVVWIVGVQAADFKITFSENQGIIFWLGLLGQFLLNFRFFYQLYYSEKHHESLMPIGFWWLSLSGSVLLIVYSIYRRDPVLLAAQVLAFVLYGRNITLHKKG